MPPQSARATAHQQPADPPEDGRDRWAGLKERPGAVERLRHARKQGAEGRLVDVSKLLKHVPHNP